MSRVEKTVAAMRTGTRVVRYDDLFAVCTKYFGAARHNGGSHAIFRMPWSGDPRVNIQRNKDGTAKPYQVRQELAAVDRYDREGQADVD